MSTLLVVTSVLLTVSSQAYAQLPAGATFTWKAETVPKNHTSPTFSKSTTDNTKTTLTMAAGELNFGVVKMYVVTKATLVVEVSGGPGIWNPAISKKGVATNNGANKWSLAGFDEAPLTQFNPATDIRIEYRIEFNEAPSQLNPNPPTQTATVGAKTLKPTES